MWDIYYLYEYVYSFMLHGDGRPLLIFWEDKGRSLCYAVMESDIADCKGFCQKLNKGSFFDWETPYGYGGPLINGVLFDEQQIQFLKELKEYCFEKKIVSQFVRFHPLLENHMAVPLCIENRYLRDTIYIDTASPEIIVANMDTKNRNMVRKARKSGVRIERVPIDDYREFIDIYNETMIKDNADEYYIFNEEYFKSLEMMKNNACIFYSEYEEIPISGAIVFYNEQYMHYHLAGTRTTFRKFSPSNLLLYEAACWGCEQGIKKFHLGGGMLPDDNLFLFKKKFNKNGRLPFIVGRTIFDRETYKYLCQMRKKIDSSFDENNNFMIQYRR